MATKFQYAEAVYRTKMEGLCQGTVQLPSALLESHHGESYSFVLKVLARIDPPSDGEIAKLEILLNKVHAEYKAGNAKKSKSASQIDKLPEQLPLGNKPSPISVAVGMYLDEEDFIVGCYNPSNRDEPEILLRGPAQFAINRENNDVEIGFNAADCGYGWKLYDLVKLLRAQPTFTHTVESAELTSYVKSESLISKFFAKLCDSVKKCKNASSVSNLVVTLSYTSTALERQRLQEGARGAGISGIRILSSTVANVISHSVKSGHFKGGARASEKFILSVQFLRQSFSMAIVRLGPAVISTRCAYGLENMPQGQDQDFKAAHSRLFQTSAVEGKYQEQIIKAYRKALEELFAESNGCQKSDLSAVIACASKETIMNITLGKFLQKKITLCSYEKGPLLGACLFASQSLKESVPEFPKTTKVVDVSRTDLQINFNGQEWIVKFRNKKFSPGVVFFHLFDPTTADKNYVIVQEEFCPQPKTLQDACIRYISSEKALAGKGGPLNEKIKLNGTVNENGIYTLSLECGTRVRAKLTRPEDHFPKQPNSSGHNDNRASFQLAPESSALYDV